MPLVLMDRIPELELASEQHLGPVVRIHAPKYPTVVVLRLDDEHPESRDEDVIKAVIGMEVV